MDRVRRLLGALFVLVIAALVVLVVAVRPGLRDDAEQVDTSWKPLIQPLAARYDALRAVVTSLQGAGAGERTVTLELTRLLDRWAIVRVGTDAEEQVATANQIEAVAARADVLARTPRLADDNALTTSIATFEKLRPPTDTLDSYQGDVAKYQQRRDGFLSRIVARLDGYPMRPTLRLVG